MFVQSFINGTDWKDEVRAIERMQEITKEDIVEWAGRYLGANNYAAVYKRMGEDKDVIKVTAPKITPIKSNRDKMSTFLEEITSTEVKPIEPAFIDYTTALSQYEVDGLNVLYVQNEVNEIAELSYRFHTGTQNDPALSLASDYLSYLGTPTRSAEEIAQEMYQLACSFQIYTGASATNIYVEGLSENMDAAMTIVEDLIYNAVPDEEILANLKADMFKERADAKLNQGLCFSALQNYIFLGKDFIKRTTLTDKEIEALTSEELLGKIRSLMECSHEVSYYGPATEDELSTLIRTNHRITEDLKPLEISYPVAVSTPTSKVYLAPYDAKQIYYLQYSNNEEKLDLASDAQIRLYNEYFGGGMNSIVFQEMREARGLAYSALGRLLEPEHKDDCYKYFAFIATQNDKMQTAIEAFDEIINDMPESETAFSIAKESLTTQYRTERITGRSILRSYKTDREMGINESRSKKIYENLSQLTLEDIKNTQKKWVEGRTYSYGILGDIESIDTKYLKTLGPVEILTLEDIFGY
jgi:predicted Zn-dependent peptidase